MNCQSCQQEFDSYRESKLSPGLNVQVEDHLKDCRECADYFSLLALADNVISEEKELLPNPFIQSRIMAGIENSKSIKTDIEPLYNRALRPAIIALSLAAAIFSGVIAGNICKPAMKNYRVPYELTLVNDAAIESVDFFLND